MPNPATVHNQAQTQALSPVQNQFNLTQVGGMSLPPRVDSPSSIKFMLDDLQRSGLTPADVGAYPVAPIAQAFLGDAAGYCIPHGDQAAQGMHRCRYNREKDKYLAPENSAPELYVPPNVNYAEWASHDDLWVVEGEKKAAAFAKHFSVPCVGIAGAWMYGNKYAFKHPTVTLLQERTDFIDPIRNALAAGKRIHLLLDGDIRRNGNLQHASRRFWMIAKYLHKCEVMLYFPPDPFKGVDDFIVGDSNACIEKLEVMSPNTWRPRLLDMLAYIPQLEAKENKEGNPVLVPSAKNMRIIMQDCFKGALVYDATYGPSYADKVYKSIKGAYLDVICSIESLCPGGVSHFKEQIIKEVIDEFLGDPSNQTNIFGERLIELADGCTNTDLLESYMQKWVTGRVDPLEQFAGLQLACGLAARIINPGCDVQSMVIIFGPQGAGKTKFFRALGNFDFGLFAPTNFAVTADYGDLLRESDKKTFMNLHYNKKLINLDELPRFSGKSQSPLKRLISQISITINQKYVSEFEVPVPWVYCGTTNHKGLLADQTGNRRYYMVQSGSEIYMPSKEEVETLLVQAAAYVLKNPNWWQPSPEIELMHRKANNDLYMDSNSVEKNVEEMLLQEKWPTVVIKGAEYNVITKRHWTIMIKDRFLAAQQSVAQANVMTVVQKLGGDYRKVSSDKIEWNGINPDAIGVTVSKVGQTWAMLVPTAQE